MDGVASVIMGDVMNQRGVGVLPDGISGTRVVGHLTGRVTVF